MFTKATLKLAVCILTLTFLGVCCQTPALPGDNCGIPSPNCDNVADGNTECIRDPIDGQLKCLCHNGLVTIPGETCIKAPELPDDECRDAPPPATCQNVPQTECENQQCKCKPPFITLPFPNQRCLNPPKEVGDECWAVSAECVDIANTRCQSYAANHFICLCYGEYVTDLPNKKCLKKPTKPGHICHTTLTPCTGNQELIPTNCEYLTDNYRCKCSEEYFTDVAHEMCILKPTKPGQSCGISTPCQGVVNTTCLEKEDGSGYFCKCIADLVTDSINGICLFKPNFPGDDCHPNLTPCSDIDKTSCSNDSPGAEYYCKCDTGYVNDYSNKRCLKLPTKPGEECIMNVAPCTGVIGTECALYGGLHRCVCNNGYITDIPNGRCVKLPQEVGDPCEPNLAPCSNILNTTCTGLNSEGAFCECISGFYTDIVSKRCLVIPTKPGHSCELGLTNCDLVTDYFTQCSIDLPQTNYFCKCSDPTFTTDKVGETCLKIPTKPGESCHEHVNPCSEVDGTVCTVAPDGTYQCICTPPLITNPIQGLCLTTPTSPGHSCDPIFTPCEGIPNTLCESDNGLTFYCKCQSSLTDPENEVCIEIPTNPGDICHPIYAPCKISSWPTDCLKEDEVYKCQCLPPLITEPEKDRCLQLPNYPGDDCALILANCDNVNNTECRWNPLDDSMKCICNDGYITDTINRKCILFPTKPGDSCLIDTPSCSNVANTTCEDSEGDPICRCVDTLITVPDLGICIEIPRRASDQCYPEIADCRHIADTLCEQVDEEYVCKCIDPLVTDPDWKKCLSLPKSPGHDCHSLLANCDDVTLTECLWSSAYERNLCLCVDGYATDVVNEKCVPLPTKPGDSCIINSDLCSSIPNTTCFDDGSTLGPICKCIGDLITEQGKCFSIPEWPGQPCSPQQAPCPPAINSTCRDAFLTGEYFCRCNGDFFTDFNFLECVRNPTQPGDRCEVSGSYSCVNINNSICASLDDEHLRCTCLNGYFHSSDAQCLLFPTKPLERCEETQHCKNITGSQCLLDVNQGKRTCQCQLDEFDLSNDGETCIIKAQFLNEICESHAQCSKLNLAHCTRSEGGGTEFRCSCLPDTHPSETIKFCLHAVANFTEGCLEDVQCQMGVGNSSCLNSNCVCDPDFLPSPSQQKCLSKSNYLEPCLESQQCTATNGEYAYCDERTWTCNCLGGTIIIGNQCVASGIGSPCESDEDCFLGGNNSTICNANQCRCNPQTVELDGKCLEKVQLGSPCESNEHCSLFIKGPVICSVNGNCVCANGTSSTSFNKMTCAGFANSPFNTGIIAVLSFIGIFLNI